MRESFFSFLKGDVGDVPAWPVVRKYVPTLSCKLWQGLIVSMDIKFDAKSKCNFITPALHQFKEEKKKQKKKSLLHANHSISL